MGQGKGVTAEGNDGAPDAWFPGAAEKICSTVTNFLWSAIIEHTYGNREPYGFSVMEIHVAHFYWCTGKRLWAKIKTGKNQKS